MWLISAGFTAVIMGMLPVGVMLTRTATRDSQAQWWVYLIFSAVCFAVTWMAAWGLRIWKSETDDTNQHRLCESEGSWWALGETRGQELFVLAPGVIAVVFVLLFVFEARDVWWSFTALDLTRTLTTFGLVVAAFVGSAPIIQSDWPPTLPTMNPAQLPEEIDRDVLFSVPLDVPDDPDVIKLTFTCHYRSAAASRGELNRRTQHTIHSWVYRSKYDESVRRDHPAPREGVDGSAVLERYIREGMSENIHARACFGAKPAGCIFENSKRLPLYWPLFAMQSTTRHPMRRRLQLASPDTPSRD